MPTTVVFFCERCPRYVAEAEVVTIQAPDGRVKIPGCPTCRGHVRREEQETKRPIERVVLREAVTPIFAKENLPLLVATTVVGFLLWRFVPLLGSVTACAILLGFAAQAMRSAADPRSAGSLGETPDAMGWSQVLAPLGRRIFVLAVALTPLAVVSTVVDDAETRAVLTLLALLFYVLYVPAGLVVAAQARNAATVLSPIAPIRVAFRIGGEYLLVAGMQLGASILGGGLIVGAFMLAGMLDRVVAILPFLVAWAVLVVVTAAQARLLGLVVREHRHVLGLG